jgi:hypothetical protein
MRVPACLLVLPMGMCLALAACGGGEEEDVGLSEEDYFDRVEALFDGARATILERVEGFGETEDEDKARAQGARLYGFICWDVCRPSGRSR